MSVLHGLLSKMITSIVDDVDRVVITELEGEQTSILSIKVGPQDFGHVIGQKGRNIEAIRTVMGAAGSKEGLRVIVEVAAQPRNK